ncbi:MAG: DEAD/DEAH box helicase [Desulfobacteraceae bacterium]
MIGPLKKIWNKVKSRRKLQTIKPKKLPTVNPPARGDKDSHAIVHPKTPAPKDKAHSDGRKSKHYRSKKRPANRKPEKWNPDSFTVPPAEGKTRFHDFQLPNSLMHAIADLGFQYCTPIQAEILPSTLEGKDATGRAQTGTGKTAAFLITVLTRMLRKPASAKRKPGLPRVLVLGPTRELVMQIGDEAKALAKYTPFNIVNVFGGMDYEKQRRQLSRGKTDIVVATPGRLLDFKRSKDIDLREVEVVIIDEADRMLDMGFIPDVRKIIYSTPHKTKRQTMLFSATLTPEVSRLAEQWTRSPITVEIEPEQVAVDTVEQLVYIVTSEEKLALLYNILTQKKLDRVIVFCNRKDETRRLADLLTRYNINCAILSGDIRQQTRVRTLDNFKAGKIRVLVATDVAGRGIHIEGMDHVINYTLPRDPEDYVHRIGRTGRAGSVGTSISFADEDDSFNIPAMEELLGKQLPCIYPEQEWLAPLPPPPPKPKKAPQKRRSSSNRRTRRSNNRPRGSRPPQGKRGGDRKPSQRRSRSQQQKNA